ncbi:MAG: hypothetical protein ACLVJ6_00800 [Merdibacter sp.]
MRLFHGKAFVIPMSGNPLAYRQAYDRYDNPRGKRHLMRIGQLPGCASLRRSFSMTANSSIRPVSSM